MVTGLRKKTVGFHLRASVAGIWGESWALHGCKRTLSFLGKKTPQSVIEGHGMGALAGRSSGELRGQCRRPWGRLGAPPGSLSAQGMLQVFISTATRC